MKTHLQNRIEKLESLLESAKLLNSTLDTQDILQSLLSESIANIKDGDAGIIFLYNESIDRLETKAYIGFDPEIEDLKLLPDESITGITFAQRKPIRLNRAEEVSAMTNTMSSDSQKTIQNIFRNMFPKVHSTISCPLLFRDHCFGVIVIDGFKEDATLTEDDMLFLESISNQAAIAINNALSLEKESKNASFLEKTNQLIETQKNAYKFTLDLHTKFTNMILHGCQVDDILFELSQLIGCDTIVVNSIYSVIGHHLSDPNFDQQLQKMSSYWMEHLHPLQASQFVWADTNTNFHFSPILVNQENYGWLGILNPQAKMSERDSIAIERSLSTLALILLKIQEINLTELRLKGEFLESLMAYQDIDYIHRTIRNYGYQENAQHALLVFDLESLTNEHQLSSSLSNGLQQQLLEVLQNHFKQIVSFSKGSHLIFLLEANTDLSEVIELKSLQNMMNASPFLKSILSRNWKLKIGASNVFADLKEFKNAYQNAVYALEVGNSRHEADFIEFYSHLKVKRFLLNNAPNELQTFAKEILDPLIQYDIKHKSHFLPTLKIYIQTNNSWSKTKEQLFIHGNTLTYRLKRIEEILGLSLDNYRDRLNIQIALEILELKH